MSPYRPDFSITWASLAQDDADRLYARFPQLGQSSESYCPTCSKSGTYRWNGTDYRCDCQQQLNLHKHYLAAGIGITYQRLGWDDFHNNRVAQQVGAFVDDHQGYLGRGMGLLFTGPYGVGKTLAANLALKQFVRLGYHCWATTFAETVESFTAGWRSPEEKRLFQERFMNTEVLLLDDIGRELRTKNQLSETTFDLILRTRVRDGRSTLLTTNMEVGELSTGYGGAVFSLLREKSVFIEVDGEDFRNTANAQERAAVKAGETRPIQ